MSLNGFGKTFTFVSRSEVRSHVLADVAKEPRTPSELASIENKHVSHVSRALAELLKEGLVEYVPSGSRERYYRATDRGYLIVAGFTIINR
jgi:predicted transcriptional regulator